MVDKQQGKTFACVLSAVLYALISVQRLTLEVVLRFARLRLSMLHRFHLQQLALGDVQGSS